jgi:lipopolysaccharide export system permease protein
MVYASNKFVIILSDAAAGKIPGNLFLKLLTYKVISVLPILLPFTMLLAVTLTYSRLNNDHEIVIFLSSGISRFEQLKIVFQASLFISFLFAVIVFYIAPWSEEKIIDINIIAKQEANVNGISEGQFKEFNKGEGIVFVDSISKDKKSLEDVFLQSSQHGKSGVLVSDGAYFKTDKNSGNRYIVFKNGKRHVGTAGKLDFQITDFESYAVLIETNTESITSDGNLDALPTSTLLNSNLTAHTIELQWRLSLVMSCILLPLFAVIISTFSLSEKRFLLIFITIISYIVYSNSLSIIRSLLEHDKLSSYPGIWLAHIFLLFTMLILYYLPTISNWKSSLIAHRIQRENTRKNFI